MRGFGVSGFAEATKGGMKVGRTEDPAFKDHYLGLLHLA